MYSLEQYLCGRSFDPELLSVLQALSNRYGADLQFLSRDTEWVNFCVRGYVDEDLFRDLQDHQNEIFGETFQFDGKFYIGRPWGRSSDRGVFLLYHGLLARGGFWYY